MGEGIYGVWEWKQEVGEWWSEEQSVWWTVSGAGQAIPKGVGDKYE